MPEVTSLASLGITASASLLGTVVGALSAYWTSKKSYERTAETEERRQRHKLLLEGAIRFIEKISEITVGSRGLERITQQWGPEATVLVAATDDDAVIAAAQAIRPGIDTSGRRVAVLLRLLRDAGVFDEDIKAMTAVLSELRLVAPADVAGSAQRVLYTAFAQALTAAIAPHLNNQATSEYNSEVNEFFNRVRHHLNVEDITFEFINEDVMAGVLDLDPDTRA